MASVLSTVLSRLNAFLDSEMEQILCFDTAVDAEKFCNEKSAIFVVLPEEDTTKYFMVSLIIQNLYREILTVADENGGRLKNQSSSPSPASFRRTMARRARRSSWTTVR